MSIGPLQMIAISFDRCEISEEIAKEINALRANGLIRLVDFVFVEKDSQGLLEAIAITDLNREAGQRFVNLISGSPNDFSENERFDAVENDLDIYISEKNIETISQGILNGGSAIIALIEHRWAARLWRSIEASEGIVLAGEFIPKTAVHTWGAGLVEAINDTHKAGM